MKKKLSTVLLALAAFMPMTAQNLVKGGKKRGREEKREGRKKEGKKKGREKKGGKPHH